MSWDSTDLSYKILVNRRMTSDRKAYYEEVGDNTINTSLSEIWAQTINSSPAQAVIDGVAELKTLFVMTEDTSVTSQQCYYAYESGNRLKDWISEKYGASYVIHLYQNTGAEIYPTDACTWFFNYQTGILTFNGSTAAFSKPFKITGYRYIGTKGAPASSVTDKYIPVQDSTVGGFVNSFLKQGRVDTTGSNIPIVSYNSTPFITFPTELPNHQTIFQYRSDFIESVYDIFGIPLQQRQYNCIDMGNIGAYTLLDCAGINWGATWTEGPIGLSYVGTLSGSPGEVVGYDVNRMFAVMDNGPGTSILFNCADGYRASSPTQMTANFQLGLNGSGNGPLFAIGLSSTTITENDQGTLLLGKNHNVDAYNSVSTIDTEPLGQIRFAGINTATPYPNTSNIDARIRAVQNGAAATDGVPVNLYLETSDGTAWNTDQLVLQSDGGSKLGYIRQGNVDVDGSNTPIISYNSTPFITPPTGQTAHLLYHQFAVADGSGGQTLLSTKNFGIPMVSYEFNGIQLDTFNEMALADDGYASHLTFFNGGIVYQASLSGLAGDTKAIESNRCFTVADMGSELKSQFSMGTALGGPDFLLAFNGENKAPRFAMVSASDSNNDDDENSIELYKMHNDSATFTQTATIDGEKLGTFRFHGTQNTPGTNFCSLYDARIRAVQNGAAQTDGVPVNLYFETSDGTAWNINQFVLQSDGGSQLGFIKQGYVDIVGSNTPIISYNSTPFFTPPTGNLNNRLYNQYHPLMNHVVIDLVGAGIYPSYCYEFSGIYNDDMAGMTLTADGYGSYWLFSPLGLMFGGTEAGLLGDVKAIEQNRTFVIQDFGPGGIVNFGAGYAPFNDGVFPYCTALFGNQGAGRGGILVVGASSDDIGETDQASLHFVKNHSDISTTPVSTVDTESLGLIRFRGTPSVVDTIQNSLYDARIRAVQNGAAQTDGVPVNLYFETSNGSSWNTNQFVLDSSGYVGIGTTGITQKLHVAGDIDVNSGQGYRINNTAPLGQYLRGDGTRFVASAIQPNDVLYTITDRTSNFSLSSTNVGGVFTNADSTIGVTYTLPSSIAGYHYRFAVMNTNGLRVITTSGDRIRVGDQSSSLGGYIDSSSVGAALELVSVDTTNWIAFSMSSTWSLT